MALFWYFEATGAYLPIHSFFSLDISFLGSSNYLNGGYTVSKLRLKWFPQGGAKRAPQQATDEGLMGLMGTASRVPGSYVIRVYSHQKDSALGEFFAFYGGYRPHNNIKIT